MAFFFHFHFGAKSVPGTGQMAAARTGFSGPTAYLAHLKCLSHPREKKIEVATVMTP